VEVGSGVSVGEGITVGVNVAGPGVWVGTGEDVAVADSGLDAEQPAMKSAIEMSTGMNRAIIDSRFYPENGR
jgi:hypothetical protein